MTFSDEYIKMVLALPEEFFENWEYSAGNKVLVNTDGKLKFYTVFGGNENGMVVINENLEQFSLGKLDVSYNLGDKYRPIPTQEQLQEIILKRFNKSDDSVLIYDVINFFCAWFQAHWIKKSSYHAVLNDCGAAIWLRYAVDVIYGKTWNGEKWV